MHYFASHHGTMILKNKTKLILIIVIVLIILLIIVNLNVKIGTVVIDEITVQ